MKRGKHNLMWLVLALVFMGQSLLPVASWAEITVRCAGMPVTSPCARMVVPLADKDTAAKQLAGFDCCRSMLNCRMMMKHDCGTMASSSLARSKTPAGSGCLVTIKPISDSRPIAALHSRTSKIHFSALVALPGYLTLTAGQAKTIAISRDFYALSPSFLTAAHGLRAPPTA